MGKYFKYAVGEILLVVIGILIALQINNWNDARKERNELHQYLNKIGSNIKLDISNLKDIKERRLKVANYCREAVANFQENNFDLKTNVKAANVFVDFYFTPNQSGFEALKNSSYLGKINGTKIDSLLDRYNQRLEETVNEEHGYLAYVENMEVLWTSKYDMSKLIPVATNADKVDVEEFDTDLQEELRATFSDRIFISTVTRGSFQLNMLKYYDTLIKDGNALIKEIKRVTND